MSLLNNKTNLVFYFSTAEYELLAENIYKKILFADFREATQKIKIMIDKKELKKIKSLLAHSLSVILRMDIFMWLINL